MLNNFDYYRYDVEILLIYRSGEFLSNIPSNVKIRCLFSKENSFLEKVFYNLYIRFGIDLFSFYAKMRISEKYDVIISFLGGQILKYHNYLWDFGNKNISWVHSDLFTLDKMVKAEGQFCTKKEEKEFYNNMDSIIFVSNDAKMQFEKLYPNNIVNKEVIYNVIEKDLIAKYRKEYRINREDKCFNIVSVGRLDTDKCYDRLIRLAKHLKDDGYNCKIIIIGDGEERLRLENLIDEYNLRDRVVIKGFINPPYETMSCADLFITTSKLEGFSLVLCEAFCLGLPVVSTKTTGPIELIDNDKYGILVDHDDESIYQGVKRMIVDEQLRLYYHQMSLERAKMFNIEETMQQVYNIL